VVPPATAALDETIVGEATDVPHVVMVAQCPGVHGPRHESPELQPLLGMPESGDSDGAATTEPVGEMRSPDIDAIAWDECSRIP
jgi:hypothetical protein